MPRKLPFDAVKDFAPITQVARVPQIIVVHPSVAAKSLGEFIALAKSRPSQINYASAGSGSSTHLAMELLMEMTGITLNHVPYKGTAPGLADVIAGHVQTCFDAIPPVIPHIRSSRVRALAIANPQRFAALPDVPTFTEAGLPGYKFGSWFGIFAPGGTSRDLVTTLNTAMVRILNAPSMKERLAPLGAEPMPDTPEAFAALVKSEMAKYAKIVRASGAKVD